MFVRNADETTHFYNKKKTRSKVVSLLANNFNSKVCVRVY